MLYDLSDNNRPKANMAKIRTSSLAKAIVLILGLVSPGCASAQTAAEPSAKPDGHFLDWENLQPPDSPNNWLLAPRNGDYPQADEIAPVFDVAPGILAAAWMAVIESRPRTEVLAVSEDGLQIEALQESALFGFTDSISSRILPLPENKSTIAIYSRSSVGYWDLGVNKRRVGNWLDALDKRIAAGL